MKKVGLKRYIITRIIVAIPTIFILLTLIFALTHIIPGDPTRSMVGDEASEEYVAQLRHKLGFDRPLHIQYFDYISGVLKGDLGFSVLSISGDDVNISSLIRERITVTFQLTVIAWTLSLFVGVSTGILSAIKEGKILDYFFQAFFLFLYSLPLFIIGIFLQLIFGVYLRMFPLFGTYSEVFRMEPITGFILLDNIIVGNLPGFFDSLSHFVLPSITLCSYYSGVMSRVTRSEMIAALNKMYCLLAEAKGLKKGTIALRHALRNAAIPILTLSSLQGISMLTGSILVETIFSLNGLASLFVQAARMRDYMLIQGCYTVFAIIAITFGILMDIIYYFVDPMVTY